MELLLILGAIACAAVLSILLLFACSWCTSPNSERPSRDWDHELEFQSGRVVPNARIVGPPNSEGPSRDWDHKLVLQGRVVPNAGIVGQSGVEPIRRGDQSAYEKRKREIESLVRIEQEDVLKLLASTNGKSQPSPLPSGNYGLIIAADATPKQAAGYCVDLEHGTCSFYSLPLTKLPWTIQPTTDAAGDSDEFEMKNFLFAILLWLPEIRKFTKQSGHIAGANRKRGQFKSNSKKVLLCTDNFACRQPDHVYGQRVTAFLTHLRRCENVLVDSRVFGTNESNLRKHATFLKPADDFSRSCVSEAKTFLTQLYGLSPEKVTPIQVQTELIHHRLTEECISCGFHIESSPSLKSFHLTT